jgi:hypothetical protein
LRKKKDYFSQFSGVCIVERENIFWNSESAAVDISASQINIAATAQLFLAKAKGFSVQTNYSDNKRGIK